MAALVDQISIAGREVGVTVATLRTNPPEPGEFYTVQTFEMSVFGEFHDVGRFLTDIASLPRILTPMDVSVERFTDPRGSTFDAPVTVNFRFQTYVVADRPDRPPIVVPPTVLVQPPPEAWGEGRRVSGVSGRPDRAGSLPEPGAGSPESYEDGWCCTRAATVR